MAGSVLRPGDRGPRIVVLRRQLAALGFNSAGGLSEVFDEGLELAVRAFQQARGLTSDGRVGLDTARALDAARWSLGGRMLRYVPGHLQRGDDVQHLQEQLQRLGVFTGRVDGWFGPDTEAGVRELQRGVGLPPDGICGPETLRALGQLHRTVSGGDPVRLREDDRVRRAGPSLHSKVVVIDPGHGGADPGLSGHGLSEADIVLDLGRRLEGRLSTIGVNALLTRSEGQNPTVHQRARFATEVGATVFITLHCDRAPDAVARPEGLATYYWGSDRGGSISPTGRRFAELVQREVCARSGLVNCRSHPRRWELLRATPMPAVWAEVGYLSNPEDSRRLAEPTFRDQITEGMLVALQRLFLTEQDDTWSTGTMRVDDVMALANVDPVGG